MIARLESVDRIVAILDYFVTHPADVGISELSRDLGLSKSVIHRMVTSLCAHGYVSVDEVSRRYRLGYRALGLGLAALVRLDLRRLARPRLERLQAQTNETVNLGLLVGHRRVYIERIESPQVLVQRVEMGRELELYRGAGGKAMLAFLTGETFAQIIAEAEQAGVRVEQLLADLAEVRRLGYALTHGERGTGGYSISAPVFDHLGAVVGALGMAGPLARWRDEYRDRYSALVLAEAQALSRELGYAPHLAPHLAGSAPNGDASPRAPQPGGNGRAAGEPATVGDDTGPAPTSD